MLATLCVPAAALEPDEVFEQVSPSIWVVRTRDGVGRPVGQGSAVVIAQDRLVTNCHVLARAADITIVRDRIVHRATLELADEERDLCQLRVDALDAPAVAVSEAPAPRIGSKVFAIGSPRGLEMTLSDGIVSGLRRSASGQLERVQTTAPISPGSSGGGLFNAQGRLIGITTATLRDSQNLNFAVPAGWITELPTRGIATLSTRAAAAYRPAPSEIAPSATPPLAPDTPLLHTGDWFEYEITDAFTGVKRSVVLRADRSIGSRVYFNGGARVESTQADLLEISSAILGELDAVTPEGGWSRDGVLQPGRRQLSIVSRLTGKEGNYRLTVDTYGEAPVRVAAGEFRAIRIEFQGWLQRVGTSAQEPARYTATALYASELRRIVRFDMDAKAASRASFFSFAASEKLELIRMGRD